MKWGKIEKEKVINLINLINVFITQNLMIWNSSEENHNTTSGSCAWKTRSHFPVENTELENWKLESVTKFRFPRPILSFPVFQFSSFGLLRHQFFKLENWRNWKSVNSALRFNTSGTFKSSKKSMREPKMFFSTLLYGP